MVIAISAAAACSGNTSTGTSRPDRYVITKAQMEEHHFQTAYEAVEALHSNWLQERGTDSFSSPTRVQVILDNANMGGVDALRSMSTMSIAYIRWYDGNAARQRWGVGHSQGVIFVSSHAD